MLLRGHCVVTNNSDYLVDMVKVKVTYIKASGGTYESSRHILPRNAWSISSGITLPFIYESLVNFSGISTQKHRKPINSLLDNAMKELTDYSWPGNIRELENLIERSIILTTGVTLDSIRLPAANGTKEPIAQLEDEMIVKTIQENERDYILKVLKKCNGKVAGPGGAADLLGIPASTLTSKMTKLGITKSHIINN